MAKNTAAVKPVVTRTIAIHDHNTKTYVYYKQDGTVTFGRFNEPGTNIAGPASFTF